MYCGTYCFAQQNIEIRSLFPDIQHQCRAYKTDSTPAFTVVMSQEEIDQERERNRQQGLPAEQFSDTYLERLAVYRKIADWMAERDVLLFHGSGLSVDGEGYLFAAPSGTGKSTHAGLWRQLLGDRVIMINDDKPLLMVRRGEVFLCGTPWSGKHHLDTNRIVPLRGIAILTRDTDNSIQPADPNDVWPFLLQQTYRPEEPGKMSMVLKNLDRIRMEVPIWELHCNMDPEAAEVAFGAMAQQKGNNK